MTPSRFLLVGHRQRQTSAAAFNNIVRVCGFSSRFSTISNSSCTTISYNNFNTNQHQKRTMATTQPCTNLLSLDSINPNVIKMEYAVRGPLVIRAGEIEKEIAQVSTHFLFFFFILKRWVVFFQNLIKIIN